VCLSVCLYRHTPVLYRNGCTDRPDFFAYRFPPTYATLFYGNLSISINKGTSLWNFVSNSGLRHANFSTPPPHISATAQPMLKLETYNDCRKTTHHAKWYFGWTTWVVWTNSQLPLQGFFLPFLVSSSCAQVAPVHDRF